MSREAIVSENLNSGKMELRTWVKMLVRIETAPVWGFAKIAGEGAGAYLRYMAEGKLTVTSLVTSSMQ